MAHDITVREDGTAEAAFSLVPAWHGLGKVFDHTMSSKEAITAAHLDWQIVQYPMSYRTAPHTFRSAEGFVANVRQDTELLLGAVSEDYKVVQNVEAFQFLDDLIEKHEMEYESAFSLAGGRKVVLLGRLPQVDNVTKDDILRRYVLLSMHHDGTGGIRFGPTSVRVVCANTYALALADKKSRVREYSIPHKGNIKDKLQQARELLKIAHHSFDTYVETAKLLSNHHMNDEEWNRFIDVMCPIPSKDDPDFTTRRYNAIVETRNKISMAFLNERQMLSGIERSAWSAFCATVEHIDHLPRRGATRENKAECRMNVCLYGAGRDTKKRAFLAACRIAGVTAV